MKQVYLDNAATTRQYQEVINVMVDIMTNHWGNPSAPYALGDDARRIIENVREQIAKDINCEPEEIIFTSGACEANSLALTAAKKIFTTKLEHKSIEAACTYPRYFDNDTQGKIILSNDALVDLGYHNWLVSVHGANGEIGVIQDIKSIANTVHRYSNIFHVDATQLYAERSIDVKALGIDMMSASAQKFHGPKGIGFLYVKNGITLKPIIYGSQENGSRGGTYNTAGIAGMGKALEMTRRLQQNGAIIRLGSLRNQLLDKLIRIPGTTLNGPSIDSERLINNINLTIDGVNAERLVTLCSLQGVYISKGSACQSYSPQPSHVLKAIGLTDEQAFNTIRITLGYDNTEEEIEYAGNVITKLVERIKGDYEA